jgi:SAM-dependent methyltransferase
MGASVIKLSLPRRNCLDTQRDYWKPPPFSGQQSLSAGVVERVRRFLDLQYASIYRDIEHLAQSMRGDVLDVGCGAQPYRQLLASQCRYVGIDSAGASLEFGPRSPDTTYFEGERWPVADESADYVLSTETMEHVLEPSVFLAETRRCLRPGGYVILTVPFSARWHFIPRDYWRFTPSSLQWMLARAGMDEVKVHARGNSVTIVAYKIMSLILMSSLGKRHGWRVDLGRLLGIAALPLLPLLALLGQVSLRFEGGDDCLGYTVVAQRPEKIPGPPQT